MGQVEIPVGAVEHNDVEIGIVLDEVAEVASSATVVAVIVLIGGWSNVTWQYLGLRRSTLKFWNRGHCQTALSPSHSCRTPKLKFEALPPMTITSYSFIVPFTGRLLCAACLV